MILSAFTKQSIYALLDILLDQGCRSVFLGGRVTNLFLNSAQLLFLTIAKETDLKSKDVLATIEVGDEIISKNL